MRTRRELLAVLAGAGLSASCGYALAGRGSFLPAYIRNVGIPMFGNKTPYFTVEQAFTEKVRVEFQSRGPYTIVPNDTGVDGVVRGDILAITLTPVGFTEQQQASRYQFTVAVSVRFDDVTTSRTLWDNPGLTFSDEYELASSASAGLDAASFLDQERSAIDRLSTDLARSVVSAILEAF
ncbi:MAG: LPS assembly lipoprotein LptE [Vicinamibacterales bacterium]|nr:LPS assembly lipoprotein LptE [Vicinamibacterales bacterium]